VYRGGKDGGGDEGRCREDQNKGPGHEGKRPLIDDRDARIMGSQYVMKAKSRHETGEIRLCERMGGLGGRAFVRRTEQAPSPGAKLTGVDNVISSGNW
jgi:hypothetical protein